MSLIENVWFYKKLVLYKLDKYPTKVHSNYELTGGRNVLNEQHYTEYNREVILPC